MQRLGAAIAAYALLVLAYGVRSGALLVCIATIGLAGGGAFLARLRRGWPATAIFLGSMLALGVYLFARRVAFIEENGGMELPDGTGSPLAFMIGWAFEQAGTTFTSLFFVLGLWLVKPWARGAERRGG